MKKGRVAWFNSKSQYGFLIDNDTGQHDLFFGRASLPYAATIESGTLVEYEIGVDRKDRPIATRVRPVNE
jgi:cold shock CspA family protein